MEHMNYALGIDIGTTSVKCVAFSEHGKLLKKYAVSYEMQHPQPDQSEQDPDEILDAVICSIHYVLDQMAPAQPVCISFSAAMHSLMAVTDTGKKLTGCIIWADNRAASIAAELRHQGLAMDFYRRSGVPVHAMSPFCKLLWFKKNKPGLFDQAHKFVGIKEYVFFHLMGVWQVDASIASATGLMNLETGSWDPDILQYTGVRAAQLSEIVPAKHILYYKNKSREGVLNLGDGVPFVVGASDGALSNIGVAPIDKPSLVVTVGTSSAARIITRTARTDPGMRSFCYRLLDHFFLVGGASNNGGVILQWLKEKIFETTDDYPALFDLAEKISPGAEGLILLPYLLGERAPIWNADAKGVFFGLTINHTKAHMVRAVMEAIAFSLYGISQTILEQEAFDSIFVTGGFIQSNLWLQILADTFNRKILVSDAVEHAALGAVIIGREALGLKYAGTNEINRTYFPDAAVHAVYQKQFEKFERIYGLLKDLF